MPDTLTCHQCNARIRVPDNAAGLALRCPRCKAELRAAPALPEIISGAVPASASDGGGSCPICQTAIAPGELVLPCPECEQVHHQECWAEVGGCGTYGCKNAPALSKDAPADDTPRAAWGDTKRCPACHETIKSIALRCRYCGTDFDTVDPLSVKDLHHQAEQVEAQRRVRTNVIVLFALSVIGCFAPVMLVVNLIWVLRNKATLAKAGPVYLILGYTALIMSVVYSALVVGFYLYSLSET